MANPAYKDVIRLRYLGAHAACAQAPYAADYLAKNGTTYLRIVLSSNPTGQDPCRASDYVMVAP